MQLNSGRKASSSLDLRSSLTSASSFIHSGYMLQVNLDFGRYVCQSDDENFNLPFLPSDLDIGNYVIAGYP